MKIFMKTSVHIQLFRVNVSFNQNHNYNVRVKKTMALFAESPVINNINICCLPYNTKLENNAIHLLGVGEGMFR